MANRSRVRPIERCGPGCARPGGPRSTSGRSSSGSGARSLRGCPARTPPSCAACPRRWEHDGSEKLAACHLSAWPRRRGATCRLPTARRSPCCGRSSTGCARSLADWADRPPRSPASSAATPPPVAAVWTTGPRPHSGMPTGAPGAPRPPSSPRTTGCGSTCRTGSPAPSAPSTAARCRARRCAGSVAVTAGARTDVGPLPGARSRSPTGCGSTSPMMGRCGSPTRRSTRRRMSRAAGRCAAS